MGQNPWEEKRMKLSNGDLFEYCFKYFDYKEPLFNVFYFRPVTHSWFILFNQACSTPSLEWFRTWFDYFYRETILPDSNTSKLELKPFLKSQENILFPFVMNLKDSWIFWWDFQIIQNTRSKFNVKKLLADSESSGGQNSLK